MKSHVSFDKYHSALKDVYIRFGANDPGELKAIHFKADQELMKVGQWDYKNPDLLNNQIKACIENIGIERIQDAKEVQWIRELLWMWYHHAVSCALWRYGDKQTAQHYSEVASQIQPSDHPNKITRLMYYLVHDELEKAEEWAQTIVDEPEKSTATHSIKLYKKGEFFKPQFN